MAEPTWIQWVDLNLGRGCSAAEMCVTMRAAGQLEALAYCERKAGLAPSQPPGTLPTDEERGAYAASAMAREAAGRIAARYAALVPAVRLYDLPNILSAETCDAVVRLADRHLRRSTVCGSTPVSDVRTSQTCHLTAAHMPSATPEEVEVMRRVDAAICEAVGIPTEFSESAQVQRYAPGEYFRQHTDYFKASEFASHCGALGNRTWTFVLYLNDVAEGGATHFPRLGGLRLRPARGRAALWDNQAVDGSEATDMLHEGEPPVSGDKYVITKWFRERRL